jgi:hypothetical protein
LNIRLNRPVMRVGDIVGFQLFDDGICRRGFRSGNRCPPGAPGRPPARWSSPPVRG